MKYKNHACRRLAVCALAAMMGATSLAPAALAAQTETQPAEAQVLPMAETEAPASITLDRTTAAVQVGKTLALTATAPDGAVRWESSNPAVATVADGVVTGIKSGTATITATAESGQSAACTVTVENLVDYYCKSKLSYRAQPGEDAPVQGTFAAGTVVQVLCGSSKMIDGEKWVLVRYQKQSWYVPMASLKKMVYAESVRLSDSKKTLYCKGNSYTLTASVLPSNTTNPTVTWSSSNTAVAVVSKSGKVTPKSAGTAVITASVDGKTAACTVTVKPLTLTDYRVTKKQTYYKSASTAGAKAGTLAAGKNVSVVKGYSVVKNGVTWVRISVGGKIYYMPKTYLKLYVPITGITLHKTKVTLYMSGNNTTLTATIAPSNATDAGVTWKTSNAAVATVSGGVVTQKSPGTAVITATAADGSKAQCTVTVKPLTLEPYVVMTDALRYRTSPNTAVTNNIAGSYSTGKWVQAIKGYSTTGSGLKWLKIKVGSNYRYIAAAYLAKPVPATSVSLSASAETLYVRGNSKTLTATVGPVNAEDKTVTWQSSNPAVATVSESGKISAVAAGTATITAETVSGKKATCKVTVNPLTFRTFVAMKNTGYTKTALQNAAAEGYLKAGDPVKIVEGYVKTADGIQWYKGKINGSYYFLRASKLQLQRPATQVQITPEKLYLEPDGEAILEAELYPMDTTDRITWHSSDEDVVTVDAQGNVIAVGLGEAVVTAEADSGESAACQVFVTQPIDATGIKLSQTSAKLLRDQTLELTAKVTPSNTTETITWRSSNEKVATVSPTGTVTALAQGSATITAELSGGKKASCKITVPEVAFGIDVSAWQKQIDWAKVKASGVTFAILRAGYGNHISQKDAYFDYNIQQAKAHGIKVGVYWFSYATSVEDARKEADVCYEVIQNYKLDYPVYFDWEYDSLNYYKKFWKTDQNPSRQLVTSFAIAFLQEMQSHGYKVGLYANPSYLGVYGNGNGYFDMTQLRTAIPNCPLWLAFYTAQQPSFDYYYNYHMWQYGSDGKVDGISGNVDCNYAYA